MLNRVYWGRALAAEALRAIIAFGFASASLSRIEARCIAKNAASLRVTENVRMTYEGTPRLWEFFEGAYQDMQLHAILKGGHPRRSEEGSAWVLANVSRHVPRDSFRALVSSSGPYG